MKKKTINKIIGNKFSKWVESIEDQEVKALVLRDTIITGGAIASLLQKEKPKDYDVYFKTKETTLAVAEYYVAKFNQDNDAHAVVITKEKGEKPEIIKKYKEDKSISRALRNIPNERVKVFIQSSGVASEAPEVLDSDFEDIYESPAFTVAQQESVVNDKPKFRPVFLSSNAITLANDIQLVIRFYGEPEEIHDNYDFIHCTNYWTPQTKTILKQEALEAIIAKELVYMGSKYPLCSIIRTRKFIKRGWAINAGQYVKMAFQLSKLDLEDINVLEDQLVGVDSAYFGMLINALRSKQEKSGLDRLDSNYVTTIIDSIF